MITITFSDYIEHIYNSFEEIVDLENYNEIIYINCWSNKLFNIPKLPNSLKILKCYNNKLSRLPDLPNSLTELHCESNNLSNLPELPNTLDYIDCSSNKLISLPELPNSLENIYCDYNKISSLPKLPDSLTGLWCGYNNLSSFPEISNLSYISIYYNNNPIYGYIEEYFDGSIIEYTEYQNDMKRKFVNKIANWFLECKYNPKYLYCRKRLMKEYEELYC